MNFSRQHYSKYKHLILAIVLGIIACFIASWSANSWKYSWIGDEWIFYDQALHYWGTFKLSDVFSLNGVYNSHAKVNMIWQAIFIEIFNGHNFGWRLSNTFMFIPISVLAYLIGEKIWNKSSGLVIAAFMVFSSFLLNYSKNGNSHFLLLPYFLLAWLIALHYFSKPNKLWSIAIGCTFGFSVAVYLGQLVPIILAPYILLTKFSSLKQRFASYALSLLYFIFVISLFVFHSNILTYYSAIKISGPSNREYDGHQQTVTNVISQFAIFFKSNDYNYNHFISPNYFILPIQLLVILGGISFIITIKKKEHQLLLIMFIVSSLAIGLTNPYWYTPTTRQIIPIAIGLIIAARGFIWLESKVKLRYKHNLFFGILLVIFIWNIYEAELGFLKTTPSNEVKNILRIIQENKLQDSLLLSNNASFPLSQMIRYFPAYNHQFVFNQMSFNDFDCSQPYRNILVFDDDVSSPDFKNIPNCTGNKLYVVQRP